MNSLIRIIGGGRLVEDCQRYQELRQIGLFKLFLHYPEFRYQFYHRIREHSKFLRILLLPLKIFNSLNLYFHCPDIGGGLFIEHGFSTIISCRKIGKNCYINQQVTIGYSDATNCPTIGDNVEIKCGAKVIGGITVGDDVIIGANAVVVKDIPPHSIVVGVPARIIKTRSSIDEEWKRMKD